MKKRNYIFEDMAIIVLLVALSAGLFFAIFNIVADRMEQNDREREESEQVESAYMLRHQIRMSGAYGMNVNFNPEI